MKKSFILHNDSLEIEELLSDEKLGQLFRAIIHYQKDEQIEIDSDVKLIFHSFKKQFDRVSEKYTTFCEQQRQRALSSGKTKKKTKRADGSPRKPTANSAAEEANSDSDSDSKNDIIDTTNISKKKSKYGEHKNVLLTEEENNKLKERYGSKYQEVLENFSKANAMKSYGYKSHYLAILKWNPKEEKSQPVKIKLLS